MSGPSLASCHEQEVKVRTAVEADAEFPSAEMFSGFRLSMMIGGGGGGADTALNTPHYLMSHS